MMIYLKIPCKSLQEKLCPAWLSKNATLPTRLRILEAGPRTLEDRTPFAVIEFTAEIRAPV